MSTARNQVSQLTMRLPRLSFSTSAALSVTAISTRYSAKKRLPIRAASCHFISLTTRGFSRLPQLRASSLLFPGLLLSGPGLPNLLQERRPQRVRVGVLLRLLPVFRLPLLPLHQRPRLLQLQPFQVLRLLPVLLLSFRLLTLPNALTRLWLLLWAVWLPWSPVQSFRLSTIGRPG